MSGSPETHPRRFEEDRLPRGSIFGLLLLGVLIGGGLCAGAWGIARGTENDIRPDGSYPEGRLEMTGKVAEVHEGIFTLTSEGLFLAQSQRRSLDEWRWVDEQKQIVHLPIDEAMRVVAGRTETGPP